MSPYASTVSLVSTLSVKMATYHRINQLDSIVFCRVMASRDHDPNSCIALLGPESSDETDSEDDMV